MNCVTITDWKSAEVLIKENGRKIEDWAYQLQTNYAYIYELNNGNVVLMPAVPSKELPACLVFNDKACFEHYVALDSFPIKNYEQHFLETDVNGLRTIDTRLPSYLRHLNERYQLNLQGYSRSNSEQWYAAVLHDKAVDAQTVVALGAVMGEALRLELGGKWVLRKLYGPYNPYFQPLVVLGDKMTNIYNNLLKILERREPTAKNFFEPEIFISRKKAIQGNATLIELH